MSAVALIVIGAACACYAIVAGWMIHWRWREAKLAPPYTTFDLAGAIVVGLLWLPTAVIGILLIFVAWWDEGS